MMNYSISRVRQQNNYSTVSVQYELSQWEISAQFNSIVF